MEAKYKFIYSPDGEAAPDCNAEDCAKSIKTTSPYITEYRVSTENVILAARALIKEGYFSHEDVVFEYQDYDESGKMVVVVSQKANINGRLGQWPPGFCDAQFKILERLI